jgi:hypothetical protein
MKALATSRPLQCYIVLLLINESESEEERLQHYLMAVSGRL